jgi:hypothetical protein
MKQELTGGLKTDDSERRKSRYRESSGFDSSGDEYGGAGGPNDDNFFGVEFEQIEKSTTIMKMDKTGLLGS